MTDSDKPYEIPATVLRNRRLSEEQAARRKEVSRLIEQQVSLATQRAALAAQVDEHWCAYVSNQRVVVAASMAIAAGDMDAADAIMDGDQVATMKWLGPIGPIEEDPA